MLGMKSDKPIAVLILQQLVKTVCPRDILNILSLVTIGWIIAYPNILSNILSRVSTDIMFSWGNDKGAL